MHAGIIIVRLGLASNSRRGLMASRTTSGIWSVSDLNDCLKQMRPRSRPKISRQRTTRAILLVCGRHPCLAALARSNGPMKRWFQFSLRTLLVAALVLPPAGYWVLRLRQAANATHDYVRAAALYDVHTATFEQVYDCSRRLRDAQLAEPFSDRRAAMIGYLNRVAHLERREESLLMFATLGEVAFEVIKARATALRAERQALEAELGVTADASLGGASQSG